MKNLFFGDVRQKGMNYRGKIFGAGLVCDLPKSFGIRITISGRSYFLGRSHTKPAPNFPLTITFCNIVGGSFSRSEIQ